MKPAAAARTHWGRKPAENELPELYRASDVLWGYWVRDNPEPSALQYYIVNYVQNDETLSLLARNLLRFGSEQLPYYWNRLILHSGYDGFDVILGVLILFCHNLADHVRIAGWCNHRPLLDTA